MIRNIKKTLMIVLMAVFVLGVGINVQAKADTLGQVKSVKTKGNYRYYEGIVSAKDMRYRKIKYKYGIKASWKKVKNASGYEIYAYGVASKKWRKVKSTKGTSYVFTNLLGKDKIKIKIRAFKKVNNEKTYGKWSKNKSIKTSETMTKITNGGHTKQKYYERYAAEQAFQLQNEYRKQVGEKPIVWSEALYEICKVRAKEIAKDFSHDKFIETSTDILKNRYGLNDDGIPYESDDGYTYYHMYANAENIAMGYTTYKSVMEGWKSSPGHYRNLKDSEHRAGAIACYAIGGRTYWTAIFGGVDLDEYIKNKDIK